MLAPSSKALQFSYFHDADVPTEIQTQPLTLRNVAALPLSFVLRCGPVRNNALGRRRCSRPRLAVAVCPPAYPRPGCFLVPQPFSIDRSEFALEPDEEAELMVSFDPAYKKDRQSHVAEKKLTGECVLAVAAPARSPLCAVAHMPSPLPPQHHRTCAGSCTRVCPAAVYQGHPRRDHVDLIGDINYPNIDLEYSKIDFGCILNNTTKSMTVKISNTSKIDCALSWAFVQDEESEKAAASSKRPQIPVNQVRRRVFLLSWARFKGCGVAALSWRWGARAYALWRIGLDR